MGVLIQEKKAGLAVLCDNAPHTLSMTLASYERSGLMNYFDDVCVIHPAGADKVKEVAAEHGLRAESYAPEGGFIGSIRKALSAMECDYMLLAEEHCMVWEHLRGDSLEKELHEAIGLLKSNQADMVRLRHSWRGKTRYNSAYTYSYYYTVEQLATMWLHSEGLSEAPEWVKTLRRFFHPKRAKRSIGRSVYVEENPHHRFPDYIRKTDAGSYIIDSEVFHWTNQPTLIARDKLKLILSDLGVTEQSTGMIGPSPQDFEYAVNNPRWRNAHMHIGVTMGIFT